MNKTIGLLIAICAFFVALFYVATKRSFWPNLTKDTPFLKRKFLATVSVLVAFLSNGKISASVAESSTQIISTKIQEEQKRGDIKKTSEWIQLNKRWYSLKGAKSWPFTEISKEVDKQKNENNEYLAPLVKKGYISQNVAYILNYVYGELLFHRLRSTSGATCYKMTQLGGAIAGTRGDLEKRLKLLSDISKKGTIDGDVLKETESNIGKDIEFMNRAQKVFDKGKNIQYGENYWEEEKALANLFKDGKVDGTIKVEEDVSMAAELIVKLNVNNADPAFNKQAKLEQLRSLKEWSQIKSNWQSVSKIERTGMDSIEKVINEKKKENWALLSKLVSAGLLTSEGAKVFNDIYADRIYHRLRPMTATCYDPTMLGMRQQQTRSDLEDRLNALSDIYKKRDVKEEVLRQAERNLLKDMEIVLLVNELWEKQKGGNWDKYRDEEQEILSYFASEDYSKVDIKDNIIIRKGADEAIEIIQLLYSD